MNTPFALPDGLTWRELDDDDKRWLGDRYTDAHAGIHIRLTLRRPDGLEREIVEDWYPFLPETLDDLAEGISYQWGEGNFGCDCNRALFFARAAGEPEPDEDVCGNAYKIVAPAWLADIDEDPSLRHDEVKPWSEHACATCGSDAPKDAACIVCGEAL